MPEPIPNEQPRYPELRAAVDSRWAETRAAFAALRRRWFQIVRLRDVPRPTRGTAKALSIWEMPLRADDDDDDRGRTPERESEALTPAQRDALDRAIEAFLRRFAGDDRTAEGYWQGDGILQGAVWLAHQVGVRRGVQLVGETARNPAFTASQRRRVMEGSFRRLSEEGRLRFEGRLEEIRDAMIAGFNAGDNPLKIARKLSRDLDGYEAGRLRTVVRSEMAIASEEAIQGTFASYGIETVEVLGDPRTDLACTSRIGRRFLLSDRANLPIYHPGCYCTITAVTE